MKKLKRDSISVSVATTAYSLQQQLELGVCDGFSLRHGNSPKTLKKVISDMLISVFCKVEPSRLAQPSMQSMN
jgi:hypothetical protein